MLQQTRVEVVVPYFEVFMRRFPSVERLAEAPIEEVLAAWSGLGYYRRARLLHRAAKRVVAAGGRFPTTAKGWLELPGVGPYTAAAIASIAFGAVEAALDGNVTRVVARLEAVEGDPTLAATRRVLGRRATELLDRGRPGDSNQALMELGATVCLPRAPRCGECPVAAACLAAGAGEAERYPQHRRRRPPVRVRRRAVVARREADGRILLFRRPDDHDLLPGTWEVPWVDGSEDVSPEEALACRYGGRWRVGPVLGRVRHAITHRAMEIEVRLGSLQELSEVAEGPEAAWVLPDELASMPRSSLVDKVLSCLDGPALAAAQARSWSRSRIRPRSDTSRAASPRSAGGGEPPGSRGS